MDEKEKIEVVTGIDVYQSEEKAAIDIQIATAKAYPREIKRCVDEAIAVVTMDKATAETCNYSLPRGGKSIAGPSVHLARVLAQVWGNLRIESKVINITHNQIISQAVCFDLEKNYAVKVEVRKRITNKHGQKFNDDMITVTGNASNAIAYRNAVFAVIPKAVTEKVYHASKNMITGDLSSEEKLIGKRNQVLKGFNDTYGVSEKQILTVLGLETIRQIKQDEIFFLIGLAQAIKDGDTTIADTFGTKKPKDNSKISEEIKKVQELIKGKKQKSTGKEDLKLKKMVFKSEDEARDFFIKDNGLVAASVEGKELYETSRELGIEVVINDGKLM